MFEITLKFDQAKVTQAENDYKKLTISPDVRQLIEQIAQMMQNFLPISAMAVKGNTWYTIKQWQQKSKLSIAEMPKMNPQERFKLAEELFEIGKERMAHMLVDPEGQKELIDEVYDKAWKTYEQYVKQASQ